ncbi:MAG TPA: hypothetical protein VNU68_08390 [Verrucomicrobiae bacterium]|nr:hypothetical protein [Verrucomicrobiae bacterium]
MSTEYDFEDVAEILSLLDVSFDDSGQIYLSYDCGAESRTLSLVDIVNATIECYSESDAHPDDVEDEARSRQTIAAVLRLAADQIEQSVLKICECGCGRMVKGGKELMHPVRYDRRA